MKVLLVDDDPSVRAMMTVMLKRSGHEVLAAEDGEQAWSVLQREATSCVISDWMMPRLSGIDLCRRIRSVDLGRYVYVLLCTARNEKEDLIMGLDAGADDFLAKPIEMAELRVRLRAGERVLELERELADRNSVLLNTNMRLEKAYNRIQRDLEAAAWMQQNLLPQPASTVNGIACEWRFWPCSVVAGDSLNCFALDEEHVGFYLLDVAGHGIPSAMLSVTISKVLAPHLLEGSPLRRSRRPETTWRSLPRSLQS